MSKIRRYLQQLSNLTANISGTDGHIGKPYFGPLGGAAPSSFYAHHRMTKSC